MDWSYLVINSFFLGVGLAVDAFSVSIANAIADPEMTKARKIGIPLTFAIFQIAMPLIGWICVHTIASYFTRIQVLIPYIALILLSIIGIKMIIEAKRGKTEDQEVSGVRLSFKALIVQGIATSIDALSVGFAIAEYQAHEAIFSSVEIGIVTFFICFAGIWLGKKVGKLLEAKASILGGIILIAIGIEIFVRAII